MNSHKKKQNQIDIYLRCDLDTKKGNINVYM